MEAGPAGESQAAEHPGRLVFKDSLSPTQQWGIPGGFPDLQGSPTGLCLDFLSSSILQGSTGVVRRASQFAQISTPSFNLVGDLGLKLSALH